MSNESFDPDAELEQIRETERIRRKRPYWRGRSQLDTHLSKLLALYDAGATPANLRDWLARPPRRISVHHSTVARWLKKQLEKRDEESS